MKIGFELSVQQQQKLVMTPELIQAIKILQLSNHELESYVAEQVLSNPILEYGVQSAERIGSETVGKEKIDQVAKYFEEYGHRGRKDYEGFGADRDNEDEDYNSIYDYVADDITLDEHLVFQLQFADLDKEERKLGKFIIAALDQNGYLTLELDEIVEMTGKDMEMVKKVVDIIKSFEPYGICATSLQDCLERQLVQKGKLSENVHIVLNNHMEDLAKNKMNKIAKKMGITVKEVQEISDTIRKCEPLPGRGFSQGEQTNFIIPDVWIEEDEGELVVRTNESATPKLVISSYYSKLLKSDSDDPQINEFLTGRMKAAIWLIDSIRQRESTIKNVVSTILHLQEEFFRKGERYLKSMTLQEVADQVGIHKSTVSRSINGKYLQCSQGVYPLKYFFAGGVQDTEMGDNISSNGVKSHIKEIIGQEDEGKPYSDQAIVDMLKDRGIVISRRTVAKYRDELEIPPSSKRRRY